MEASSQPERSSAGRDPVAPDRPANDKRRGSSAAASAGANLHGLSAGERDERDASAASRRKGVHSGPQLALSSIALDRAYRDQRPRLSRLENAQRERLDRAQEANA